MSIKVVIRRIAIKVGIKGVRVKIPDRSEVTQTTFLRANEIRFTLILRITIRIEKEILEAFEEHLDFEIEPFSNCLCRLPGAYSSLISYRLSCKIKRKKKKKEKNRPVTVFVSVSQSVHDTWEENLHPGYNVTHYARYFRNKTGNGRWNGEIFRNTIIVFLPYGIVPLKILKRARRGIWYRFRTCSSETFQFQPRCWYRAANSSISLTRKNLIFQEIKLVAVSGL